MLSFKQFITESESQEYIHYSHKPNLTHLSGHMSGTGIKGAEQERLSKTKDERIKKRVYFYPPTEGKTLPRPESGLGSHVYKAKLDHMYDARKTNHDSHKIEATKQKHVEAGEHPGNAFERAVVDHGYHGYHTDNMSVVLNKDVPVKYHGTSHGHTFADHKFDTKEKKKSVFDSAPNKEGNHTSSLLEPHQTAFFYKHKEELQKAAPSLKMEYGRLSVHKDHKDALHTALEKHTDHPL